MLQPDSFTFVISDNGVGLKAGNALDQDRIFSGQGLRNLAQRLGKIGGTYVISASPGGGTQVRLNVQMNHKP
jgi:signal transduction histidine kinase